MAYVIALYLRTSKEEGGEQESNSISNQRMLLYAYIHKDTQLRNCKIVEKCDDGYSGKKTNRPQFQALLQLARQKKINCIIVKDFSRFSRDYIEMGTYLEQIFPFLGVRFISINDHYDSAMHGKYTTELDIACKNFMYDFYSRDISKKVKSVRKTMAQQGKFTSAYAPYGYVKSSKDKHILEIDKETAPIVRKIFALRMQGYSAINITKQLNQAEIPSPAQYALQKKRGMDWRKIKPQCGWDVSKVIAILKDERYAGNMVSHTSYNQQSCIRVENTHEAIVSYTDFLAVQDTFTKHSNEQAKRSKDSNVFVCGHCGRKLSYSRNHKNLICRYGAVNPNAICYQATYVQNDLRSVVMQALRWYLCQFVQWDMLQKEYQQMQQKKFDVCCYRRRIQQEQTNKLCLYETYRNGNITKQEYLVKQKECNHKIQVDLQKIADIETQKNTVPSIIQRWKTLIHSYLDKEILTKQLERIFIQQVCVYDAEHIKITWKFADVFCS